jgi:O-acetyl-ADP-ribose deacetylase (regulator of RNase III)
LAADRLIQTIAFPNISTGIYGYPKEAAAKIAIDAVTEFLNQNDQIQIVFFVCFDVENYRIYEKLLGN